MKTMKLFIITILFAIDSYSQSGTAGKPFTSLTQAASVTSAGIYYFNLGGTTFNTYVNNAGWVQVAIDFGGKSGNLPTGTSLNTTTRGILSSSVLAKLTEAFIVRISSSSGSIDITSTNATIVSRLLHNTTLHQGKNDTTISKSWVGTGASHMGGTSKVSCITSSGNTLPQNIIHPCGDNTGNHWIPSIGMHTELASGPEIPSTVYFQLWVRSSAILPVKLLSFNAGILSNKQISLDWATATEFNNNYFTIERSINGSNWEAVTVIKGAGNSVNELKYNTIDKTPYAGVSYYRLKQTDIDGKIFYSQVRKIQLQENIGTVITAFPNPTYDKSLIKGNTELGPIHIFNLLGEDISSRVKIIRKDKMHAEIYLGPLKTGIYIVAANSKVLKICRL